MTGENAIWQFAVFNINDMHRLGKAFSFAVDELACLGVETNIGLIGNTGLGKTTFTQALLDGLEIMQGEDDCVRTPHIHEGKIIWHDLVSHKSKRQFTVNDSVVVDPYKWKNAFPGNYQPVPEKIYPIIRFIEHADHVPDEDMICRIEIEANASETIRLVTFSMKQELNNLSIVQNEFFRFTQHLRLENFTSDPVFDLDLI